MAGSESLPRWDLATLWKGFGSPEWSRDKERARAAIAAFADFLAGPRGKEAAALPVADWLAGAFTLERGAWELFASLNAYVHARNWTDTEDPEAEGECAALEPLALELRQAAVLFREALSSRRVEALAALQGAEVSGDPRLAPFAFHAQSELFRQERQLPAPHEELAAELGRTGAEAWRRLHETIVRTARVPWDQRTGEWKSLGELRSLASDPKRERREKAWRLELELLEGEGEALAAALNGVKGEALALDRRRGWASALDKALAQDRLSRTAFDALLGAMEASLPAFRRYLDAKARFLGLPRLAYHDLHAPLSDRGLAPRRHTWLEASGTVVAALADFDPAMGDFARRALDSAWVDAEPREGKAGGAFCLFFPGRGESRILLNYDGSWGAVAALAHELGHAWHNELARGLPVMAADWPPTLAETASILAETLVHDAAAAKAARGADGLGAGEELHLADSRLQAWCQSVVGILARFRFEDEVLRRRATRELPPVELCDLMADAQAGAYGPSLDPGRLHPWLWAVKAQCFRVDRAYLNYPYAFGLLLALGLVGRWRAEGPAFVPKVRDLLRKAGSSEALPLCAAAGLDIEDGAFWRDGVAAIEAEVSRFEHLVVLSFNDETLMRH